MRALNAVLLSLIIAPVCLFSASPASAADSCQLVFNFREGWNKKAVNRALEAALNPPDEIVPAVVQSLGLALVRSDSEYRSSRYSDDTKLEKSKSEIPLLNGYKEYFLGGFRFLSNGRAAFHEASWSDSDGEPIKSQMAYLREDGHVELINHSEVFAAALPKKVILSRSMSEQEWDAWQKGRVGKIRSQVNVGGRGLETEPTTTFALNRYKFGHRDPVLITMSKAEIVEMVKSGELEFNTYSWQKGDLAAEMKPSNYSSIGLPVELKVFGNQARQKLVEKFRAPRKTPDLFYPNYSGRGRFRWTNESLNERIHMVMSRDVSEVTEREIISKVKVDKKSKLVTVKVNKHWNRLSGAQKRRATLFIHGTILGLKQLNSSKALEIIDHDGKKVAEFNYDGKLVR